ncbi:MAG: peptidase [Chitinophagaceae bacterium]|nr:MAG: peptidase [Chitinophagaceae bacterium]
MNKKNIIIILLLFIAFQTVAQKITSPKEFFGFNIGDSYQLANYTAMEKYFKLVTSQTDRARIEDIGKTEEGRTQYMMIVSAPENMKNIAEYKQISQQLARAEISVAEANSLAKKGKAIVWIDGGLHSTETVATQQLVELYYQLLTRTDEETLEILNNTIILLSNVNPDGTELVSNWYMQNKDSSKRNMSIPRLYQKYIGHDNNRDFYMINMKETKNIVQQHYIEWMPQIIYNHHQSAPAGAVVAGPPYRPPYNYDYDPLIITQIDGIGASMINRLNAEGKPGFTRLDGSVFNGWWDGGLRTAPYYHNMIGILTEIIGNPTPSKVPLVPSRILSSNSTPYPVYPQNWTFQKSIDYSISMSYSILDYAAKMKTQLLKNIFLMGKNSIDKGSKDTWTVMPYKVDSLNALIERNKKNNPKSTSSEIPSAYFDSIFKSASYRDPRGFIIPSNQKDFPTAIQFINALIKSGLRIEQATSNFTVEGKKYPAGSYIVKTNQAFRPHVLDMFEPQNYPNDFQYPGGPPIRPYDAAGWTLAYQMGVEFDRIINDFSGPFKTIPYGVLQTPEQQQISKSESGYMISPDVNNHFIAINILLKNNIDVYRFNQDEKDFDAGSFYTSSKDYELLKQAGLNLGIEAKAIHKKPTHLTKITPARIALFDKYGGSMPSGWARWIMEQYQFPFKLIFPQELDKGNLNKKYDIILFIDEAMPTKTKALPSRQPKAEDIPAEFRDWLGTITVSKTIPQLKNFLNNGGQIITTCSSATMAYLLDLPVKNALTKIDAEGKTIPIPDNDYYIPGSILNVTIDHTQAENRGMKANADMVFSNSPVFSLNPDAIKEGIRPLAWFSDEKPLRSGWAWGQTYLKNGIVAFSAPVGKGKFYACGTEITFRAQSHGTFKMLFNQLYLNH